jgi:hypothetical protein
VSSPWSLEFVIAVIIGALLVPGCRADPGRSSPPAVSMAGSSQLSSGQTARAFRWVTVAGRPETRPVVPATVAPVRLRLP